MSNIIHIIHSDCLAALECKHTETHTHAGTHSQHIHIHMALVSFVIYAPNN